MEESTQLPNDQPTTSPLKSSSHTEELVDHYWGTLNHVNSLIKSSELKAGLILSFYGILLNFVYQSAEPVLETGSGDPILYTLLGLWFIVTVISIFRSVQCFIPKIEGKFTPNVFFFRDVITKFGDVKSFSKTFYEVSCDEKRLFEQLGEQIFIISKIAAKKFKHVRWSITLLGIGLVLLSLILLYAGFTTMIS
ncbi:MAG: ABC transporter ATP-binding protein [Flavobacteriaceae bacterium]|nr:ABC transporter ATP-binding protein [Flavobacteriaceae bacterium]